MRIDKFLKISRIIKRRTVANDACDASHVSVNGKPAKASYDVNNTDSDADYCVLPGTEITRVGIGVEHFLIKGSKDVRLHFNGHYTFGNNGNPSGDLIDKQSMGDVGITWRVNIL